MSDLGEKIRERAERVRDRVVREGGRSVRALLREVFPDDQGPDFIAPEPALVREFKPEAARIEEAPSPFMAKAVLYGVIAFLAIAVLWALIGKIDRIVVAQGKIVTTSPVAVLQAFGTSRIQAILVHPGDHVRKGQPVVSFDPAFAQADLSTLETRVRGQTAEVERLKAELSGAAAFTPTPATQEERVAADIFRNHTAQLATELERRDSAIKQTQEQIAADRASLVEVARQDQIAKQVTGVHKLLYEQKAGAWLQVIEAQKDQIDVELKMRDLKSDEEKLAQQLIGLQAERKAFLDGWSRELSEKLADSNQKLAEAQDDLSKARRIRDFATMTSPVSGIVLEVADRSVGSVVREAETLVTVVPSDAHLELRADLLSRDVSFVRVHDPVFVKLEAYPFQRYGALNGRLEVVSPDSVTRKSGDRMDVVFPARVRLDDTPAELAARGIHLGAGLVATAEIKTGERSIASYVLYPVVRSWDEGMREP
ncbi:MAG: HlyD family type I secretion periplasmic adaptor subunit [Alphaproteobacteria bacterium]|nr:HlyD family type I secretion periplasmic adaptor subunit [Alphaproteobacteria bacterium]